MSTAAKLSCIILTGFLGSGKTTLLNRLLKDAEFQGAAVLINEFGEVPLDHELIVHSEDRLVVLSGGCVCCALREDVEGALRQLFEARDAGTVPPFTRIVIETTGLADPVPLLMTLQAFGLARERLQAPLVVTTVDAGLHHVTTANHPQALRQLAIAQLVLITKSDIVGEEGANKVLSDAARLNPWARIEVVGRDVGGSWLARALRECQTAGGSSVHEQLASLPSGPGAWLTGKYQRPEGHGAVSFPVIFDSPVDWTAFGVWMTLLLHRHGTRVLRIKGLLHVAGLQGPVVFHAAQHMVHPPEHWDEWPSPDRRTRLVFIVEGLDPTTIRRSLNAFLQAARAAVAVSVDAHHVGAGAGGTVRGRPVRRPTAPRWIRG